MTVWKHIQISRCFCRLGNRIERLFGSKVCPPMFKIPSEIAKKKEAPQIQLDFDEQPKTLLDPALDNVCIKIEQPQRVEPVSSIPLSRSCGRVAKISPSIKTATQSGTHCDNAWQLEFNVQPGWENPLMGWHSSGDPLSCLRLYFRSKEDAILYCEENCLKWFIWEMKIEKKFRIKNYAHNFHNSKRTRVSTK